MSWKGPVTMANVGRAGWLVAVSGFVHLTITFGVISSFVVIFVSLEDEFETSAVATGWMGSLAWGVTAMFSPVSTLLVTRLGHRLTAVLGVLLCFLGLLVTAFLPVLWAMYLTFGVVFAAGTNMLMYTTFHLLSVYLPGETGMRQFAVVNLSGGVATLAGTVLVDLLNKAVGWRVTYPILSGSILVVCLPMCFFFKSPVTSSRAASKDAELEDKAAKTGPNKDDIATVDGRISDSGMSAEFEIVDEGTYLGGKANIYTEQLGDVVVRNGGTYDGNGETYGIEAFEDLDKACNNANPPDNRCHQLNVDSHTPPTQLKTLVSRVGSTGQVICETEQPICSEEIVSTLVIQRLPLSRTSTGKTIVSYVPLPSSDDAECLSSTGDSAVSVTKDVIRIHNDTTKSSRATTSSSRDITRSPRAFRVPGLWLFAFGIMTTTLASIFNVINLVSFMTSISLPDKTRSLLLLGLGLAEIFGRIVSLLTGNSLPIPGIVVMVTVNVAAGIASFVIGFYPMVPTIAIYIAVAGITRGIFFNINIPVALGIFHRLDSGVVINFILIGAGLGGLLSSTFGGLSMDMTGSYETAFFTCSSLYFASSFIFGSLRMWPKLAEPACCLCSETPGRSVSRVSL